MAQLSSIVGGKPGRPGNILGESHLVLHAPQSHRPLLSRRNPWGRRSDTRGDKTTMSRTETIRPGIPRVAPYQGVPEMIDDRRSPGRGRAPIAAPAASESAAPASYFIPGVSRQIWRAFPAAISSHDARGTRPGATTDRGGGDPCDSQYRNSPGSLSVLPNRRPPGPGRNQAPARGASHYTDSHDANHGRP